jgi:hypothetical protein
MGHCAPTQVRTLLEASGLDAPHPVALTVALPGMGNTGNECAHELSARRLGFGSEAQEPGSARAAIERTFSPEFRNRLDARVAFDSLPSEVIRKVVE